MRLQANVENLFDAKYYVNADSNTNISPGLAARAARGADHEVLRESRADDGELSAPR